SDSEFRIDELVKVNNEVLIATWGNLANRVTSMLHRNFDGVVPEPGELPPESVTLLEQAQESLATVATAYGECHFRNALQEAMRLAQLTNRYLDERAPWKAVKTDLPHAGQ